MHTFHLPAFRKNHYLVLTSYKVMYAFLNNQDSVERLFWNKRTISIAVCNQLLGRPVGISLFRNPEARFLSYFRDKFRKTPIRILQGHPSYASNIQHCQSLWLQYIDKDSKNVSDCCRALLETSIEDVVNWLSNSYRQDCHTIPQMQCHYAQWRQLRFRLSLEKIFFVDNPAELNSFAQLLKLDISHRVNGSQDISEEISLSKRSRKVLREIYRQDFDFYEKASSVPPSDRDIMLRS